MIERSHGPQIELYLAEEAIGLVKSRNWEVVRGPFWNEEESQEVEDEGEEENPFAQNFEEERTSYKQRVRMKTFSQRKNIAQMKRESIQDGDYVYAPNDLRGVYFVREHA